MNMFKQLLHVHWKAVRWPLVPFVLLAFGMPLYILRIIHTVPPEMAAFGRGYSSDVLHQQEGWVTIFPVLACIIASVIAITAWSWDHQARHVYALSLPVSRTRYALMKMGAGLLILAIPIVALLAGTLIGLAMTKLPPAVHGYPFSFAARFMLSCLIIYAVVFALASSTVRTTSIVLASLVIIFVFGSITVTLIRETTGNEHLITPGEILYEGLTEWPGPFNVFGGSWMIIDA